MKPFRVFLILVLAAFAVVQYSRAAGATPTPVPVVTEIPADTDWVDLEAAVKAGKMSMADALATGKAIHEAVEEAQALSKKGEYEAAADKHPISYCKAWYTLNALREMMGGARDENGTWSDYNLDKKGKYAGTKEQRDRCVEIANDCLQYIADAKKAKRVGPGDKDDTVEIEKYVTRYLKDILE